MTSHSLVRTTVLLLLSALVATAAASAQAPTDPTGSWNGAIKIPGAPLDVVVTLKVVDGAPSGSIDIPKQNAKDLPLGDVKFEGAEISFAIANIPGAPTFVGTLSEDGGTLSGKFKQGGMTFPFTLERAKAADPTKTFDSDAFAAWCEEARGLWNVPGLAVALVRKDGTFFIRGFGLRDLEHSKPVDDDTVFAIGSTTKAMTAWILATLVEEKKIKWDDPVRKHAPSFALKDAFASERVMIGDLVTHRTGLPRHDLVWYGADATREELVRAMAHLEPTAELRASWQYNNLAFNAAGWLAEQATGSTWEDLVRERIFEPLGMKRAQFSVAKSEKDLNAARPYVERESALVRVPYRNLSAIGPAGAVNASVENCARWIRLQLGDGTFEGKTLLPAAAAKGLHKARTLMDGLGDGDDVQTTLGYGAGWMVHLYRGKRLVEHGGGIDGFTTAFAFFPEEDFGVVAIANRSGTGLPGVVVRQSADRFLGLEPRDWSAEGLAKVKAAKAAAAGAESRKADVARENAPPSRDLQEFVGEYRNDAYGLSKVALKDGALSISIHGLPGPLVHRHFDVFRIGKDAVDPTLDGVLVQFRSDFEGEVAEFVAPLQPGAAPIVFKRVPSTELSTAEYLARFEGGYRLEESVVHVELKNGVLEFSVPGQSRYTLDPTREMRFALRGMEGYSLRFTADANGRIEKLFSHQPEGVYEMTRVEKE